MCLGQHAALLAELTSSAGTYQRDERVAGQLMLALHCSGRQAETLHRYDELRTRLADQVGTDHGLDMQKLPPARLVGGIDLAGANGGCAPPAGGPRQLPGAGRGLPGAPAVQPGRRARSARPRSGRWRSASATRSYSARPAGVWLQTSRVRRASLRRLATRRGIPPGGVGRSEAPPPA
ncbi:BTAD domain-containing putative transcriptional regulator [Actinokineospora diospyrosa]|uniref:BTAD domain-containing putative transcriptional regulator n=1 Tax=Actinokineospora diospyrosa TaxID=103728 RepID=UPI003CD08020